MLARLGRGERPHRLIANLELVVLDGRGRQIDLLVVPAQTGDDEAHAMMMAAAAPDDVSPVDILLAGSQGSPKTLSA